MFSVHNSTVSSGNVVNAVQFFGLPSNEGNKYAKESAFLLSQQFFRGLKQQYQLLCPLWKNSRLLFYSNLTSTYSMFKLKILRLFIGNWNSSLSKFTNPHRSSLTTVLGCKYRSHCKIDNIHSRAWLIAQKLYHEDFGLAQS